MKKIVSMLMIFVAVMVFSGLMAEPVSAYSYKDVGSQIQSTGYWTQISYSWHLVYYNSKHCTFRIGKKDQLLLDYGHYDDYTNWIPNYVWDTSTAHLVNVDFKKVNKNHVRCTTTGYVNGVMVSSSSYTKRTSLTPYKYFKTQKNNILGKVGVS